MAEIKTPLDSESVNTIAQAIHDAGFTPWQLIILIFGVMILWNVRSSLRMRNERYQTQRKYDLLDKKAESKRLIANEKSARKRAASAKLKGNS